MSFFQIMIQNSKTFRCISFNKYSVFEAIKCCERYLSDVKNNHKLEKPKNQTIRNKNHSIVSADLMSVANETRTTKRKRKELIKPVYYKGEILFGAHPVYLALLERKRHLFQLFTRIYKEACYSLEKLERINKIEKLAKTLGIPVHNLHLQEMEYLAPGSVHQGVCLDVSPLPVPEWEDTNCTLENQESSNLPIWLVLNEILDPMNVGAVIRSAQYFGIDKLFVVKGSRLMDEHPKGMLQICQVSPRSEFLSRASSFCKLSPTVSKASSGALEIMEIYQIQKLENFLQVKKAQGWNIISTVAYCEDESEVTNQITDITDFKISKPTVLILGNEGKGISPEIQKHCDNFVSIPPKNNLHPGIDSLNVSVATGVILYSLSSRRKDSH